MQQLTQTEINEVNGGWRPLMMVAEFIAGYAAGKLLDKMEDKSNTTPFEVTPEMNALIAGNMTA